MISSPQGYIAYSARHHTHLTYHGPLTDRHAVAALVGRAAARWLETGNAAEGGGDSHAAANIRSQAKRRSARRNDGAFTATAASRAAFEVPWIVGSPIDRIIAFIIQKALSNVRFAEDDGPGRSHSGYIGVVSLGKYLRSRGQTKCRGRSHDIDGIFNRDRHTVESAQLLALCTPSIGLFCFCTRLIIKFDDDGVHCGIDLLYPFDMNLNHLR
jgi:hypothetical protein